MSSTRSSEQIDRRLEHGFNPNYCRTLLKRSSNPNPMLIAVGDRLLDAIGDRLLEGERLWWCVLRPPCLSRRRKERNEVHFFSLFKMEELFIIEINLPTHMSHHSKHIQLCFIIPSIFSLICLCVSFFPVLSYIREQRNYDSYSFIRHLIKYFFWCERM